MKKSNFEKLHLSSESEVSFNKKSPIKTSPSPTVTTRSRRHLIDDASKSPTISIKQELKIETNYHHTNNDYHPNLPSANSSDFSVVYVDDSDVTNHSDIAVVNEDTQSTQSKKNRNGPRAKSKTDSKDKQESKYKLVNTIREEHNENVYDIKIYKPYEINPDRVIFAGVGKNKCSVYEYLPLSGEVEPIDIYADADPEEDFYTCAWTTDLESLEPILVCGGLKGIIRTIVPFRAVYKNALIGHGASINELKFHPTKNNILLSASKDYTLRLWNINTTVCIAIFGGAEGHTDQVLSADINLSGTHIISCGIDHYLKIWSFQTPKLKIAIEISETFDNTYKSFPTVSVNFPDFSTREIHTNYVDCVKWFGDLVISKSCEGCLVEWKPGLIDEKLDSIPRTSKNVTIMQNLEAKECDMWFVRFGLDFSQKELAVGTSNGKIYVWHLDQTDSNDFRKETLTNQKSKGIIRSIAMTMNGNDLFATNNLGYIFIWKKE